MSAASRSVLRIGVIVGTVFAVARPPVALASRPATTVGIARVAHGVGSSRVEVAGRYVSGGGRGARVQTAPRRDAPPPTTRAADPRHDACVVVNGCDGRRRTPQSRTMSPIAAVARLRLTDVGDAVPDRRTWAPAALYYDAHAPPSSARAAAGLLA
jgi:hypothetical protein